MNFVRIPFLVSFCPKMANLTPEMGVKWSGKLLIMTVLLYILVKKKYPRRQMPNEDILSPDYLWFVQTAGNVVMHECQIDTIHQTYSDECSSHRRESGDING